MNNTLRHKKCFQVSNCELSIHMWQHSINTCIWSIYLSVDTISLSLWLLAWFLWLLLTRKLLKPGFLVVSLKSYMTWLIDTELSMTTCGNHNPFISSFIHPLCSKTPRVKRRVPLVVQELPIFPEYLSSLPTFEGFSCSILASCVVFCR